MRSPVSVANKRLTRYLSPLDSALTKNRGRGGVMVNQTSDEGCRSRACNSCVCLPAMAGHSYESNPVYTNNSHSGTQNAAQSLFPNHSSGGTASLSRCTEGVDLSKRFNVQTFFLSPGGHPAPGRP